MKFGDEELTGKELGPVRFSFNNDAAKQHIGLARRYLGDMKQRMQLGNLGQLYDEKTLKDGSIIKMWSNKNGLADIDMIDIVSPVNESLKSDKEIVIGYIIRCVSHDISSFSIKVDLPNGEKFDLSLVADTKPFAVTTDLGLEALATKTGFSDNGCKLVDVREWNELDEKEFTNKYQAVCPTFIDNISEAIGQGPITMTADSFTGTNLPGPYVDVCTVDYVSSANNPPTIGGSINGVLVSNMIGKNTTGGDAINTWNDYRSDAITAMNDWISGTVYPLWLSYYEDTYNFDGSVYLNDADTYTIANPSYRIDSLWRRKDGAGFLIDGGVNLETLEIGDKGGNNGDMCFFMIGAQALSKNFKINQSIQDDVNSKDSVDIVNETWFEFDGPSPGGPSVNNCIRHIGANLYPMYPPGGDQSIAEITNTSDFMITDKFGVDINVPFGQHKCHVESISNVESDIEIFVYTNKRIIPHKTTVPSFETKHFIINVCDLIEEGTEFFITDN